MKKLFVDDVNDVLDVAPVMSDFRFGRNRRGDLDVFLPSLTRQEFAEECDINTIMARYEAGGAITHVNKAMPIYMDMTDMPDLRQSLDIMREAGIAFAALPAKVRREFDNDPQKFVDFAQAPENLPRMREWGLAPAAPVEAPPMKVQVINPEPPADVKGGKPVEKL